MGGPNNNFANYTYCPIKSRASAKCTDKNVSPVRYTYDN